MAVESGVNPAQMDFWDGMESVFFMPSITPAEREAVWDAVASFVQQQLSLHKGVRIPTLGSFDVVHTEALVGNKPAILQRPVFQLARNLGGDKNLKNKDDLPGGRKLEPLKYARVALEASVSRRKAECCILGTTSLLYHCLEKGASVAFVLRDVGVLLITGSRVQMRFYLDLLQQVIGERIQDGATLKALQQLDMVMPQAVSISSLSLTGPVVVFPNFEQTFLGTSLSRDHLQDFGSVPGEDKRSNIGLSAIRQGVEGRFPGQPVPAPQGSTGKAGEQLSLRDEEAMEMRHIPRGRKLPAIPGAAAAGGKQPVSGQTKGKPVPKGQAWKERDKEAAATQKGRGGRGGGKDTLGREGERKIQLGKQGERRDSLGREGERGDPLRKEGEKRNTLRKEGEKRDPLRKEGEKRDPLRKEGEKKDPLGREGEKKDSFRKEGERRDSLGREGVKKDSFRKEGERRDSLGREGEKKIGQGKEKKAKDAVGSEGEKKDHPKRGENKVSPRSEGGKKDHPKRGENKASPRRKGEKEVPLGRGEKKVPLGRGENFHLKGEELKYLLEREREKKLLPGRKGERQAPLGSTSLAWRALARRAQQDSKVFILQQPGPEAPQSLRARPEVFWSVVKEPQKSILAGYRFESSRLLPPLPPQDSQLPVLKKRERVARGPWPWVE